MGAGRERVSAAKYTASRVGEPDKARPTGCRHAARTFSRPMNSPPVVIQNARVKNRADVPRKPPLYIVAA